MDTTTEVLTFTKAEALRRLTVLTVKLRKMGCVPFGASFEIGERTHPEIQPNGYVSGQQHEDDDLLCHWTRQEYAKQGLRHGEVVHIYVTGWDGFEHYLDGTHCGWVGTPDAEPMIVNIHGAEIEPR